jgi:outer membrane protein assembly factor BamD
VKINIFYVCCLLLICLIACSKKQTVTIISSPDQEFHNALDQLQVKKYNKAIELFQNLVFNYPGSSYAADAQFYLADAYFQKKDYQSAIPEFEFFINSFTGNQYLEDAIYKLALCYFNIAPTVGKDQVILSKTLDVLEDLQERFPETKYQDQVADLRKRVFERWAEKSYLIGKLYFTSGEFQSARVYLDYVLNEYPNTKWAIHSKFLIGQIYEKTDSTSQAITIYESLKNDSTDASVSELAKQRLEHLQPK